MKYEIEIEGIPDGWEVRHVSLRFNQYAEIIAAVKSTDPVINQIQNAKVHAEVFLQKKQPRRIVLEETNVVNAKISFYDDLGMWTYWKIVDEKEDTQNG